MKTRTKTLIRVILILLMTILAMFCFIQVAKTDTDFTGHGFSFYKSAMIAFSLVGGGMCGYGFVEFFIDVYEIYFKK